MNATEKDRRFQALTDLGCIVCGAKPAAVHHLTGLKYRGMSRKADDRYTVPLCAAHHQGHGHGVSIHDGIKAFERQHGTQESLLQLTDQLIGFQ